MKYRIINFILLSIVCLAAIKYFLHLPRTEEKDLPVAIIENTKVLSDASDCGLLSVLFDEKCVIFNSKINTSCIRNGLIIMPVSQYEFHCDEFFVGDIPFSIEQRDVNIKNYDIMQNTPSKAVFYLMKYENDSNFKSIELFYRPSGSIFKVTIEKADGQGIVRQLFCAKF